MTLCLSTSASSAAEPVWWKKKYDVIFFKSILVKSDPHWLLTHTKM